MKVRQVMVLAVGCRLSIRGWWWGALVFRCGEAGNGRSRGAPCDVLVITANSKKEMAFAKIAGLSVRFISRY